MRYRRLAITGLTAIAASYVALCAGLYFYQEHLLFHPSKLDAAHKFDFPGAWEERPFEVQGAKIHSMLFRPAVPPKGMIVYFHGNKATIETWGDTALKLVDRFGWSVWMVDYPGFGKSEGEITSEDQLHTIAHQFWSMAANEAGAGLPLVVYGRSLGTGLALKVASENPAAGLILESPYFSMKEMANERYPFVPSFLLRYQLRSDEWFPKVATKTLIIHGDDDEVIPVAQAVKLSTLSKMANLVLVRGGRHNDLAKFPEYWNAVTEFLR